MAYIHVKQARLIAGSTGKCVICTYNLAERDKRTCIECRLRVKAWRERKRELRRQASIQWCEECLGPNLHYPGCSFITEYHYLYCRTPGCSDEGSWIKRTRAQMLASDCTCEACGRMMLR